MDQAGTVTEFIVANFLPDATADQLGPGYDLLANGVIAAICQFLDATRVGAGGGGGQSPSPQ